MIFIDSSEVRANSSFPDIPGATIVDNLESITGADFMLSTKKFPATNEILIQQHITHNALLVQRKSGHDLSSSVGERMNSSLTRMHQLGAKQSQCILLFIGVLTCNDLGQAVINRQTAHMPFWAVQSAISKWHDRGGVYENIHSDKLVSGWCEMKLRHLNEYEATPIKKFSPATPVVEEFDEFLQVLVPVEDGRVTLATLPGIGAKTANLLWDRFGNLAECISFLTMPYAMSEMKGLGKKTSENVREWLGLNEAMGLAIEVDDTLLKQLEKKRKKDGSFT